MHTIWNLPVIRFVPFPEIQEAGDVALVTSRAAWQAVRDRLHLNVGWQADVTSATLAGWDTLLPSLQVFAQGAAAPLLYAVGGGLAVDAAKYLAAATGLPLTCLPTALSVDAFLTWAAGIRQDGCVRYVETGPPERLLVDLDVLAAAPPAIRAAGLCDVLSIATGAWDWRFAADRGQNPPDMAYLPYVDQAAQAILQGGLACAEAAGRGDLDGLKQLLDCLALEVQLCNQIGHSRPEEGSEHYFAYAVENELGPGLSHGALVGPGILQVAALQGQDTAPLRRALAAGQVPLDAIPESVVEATLRGLPAYVQRHDLPYGIAHAL